MTKIEVKELANIKATTHKFLIDKEVEIILNASEQQRRRIIDFSLVWFRSRQHRANWHRSVPYCSE